MTTRVGTTQRKTRHKYKASIREKGKVSVSRYLQEFDNGAKVGLKTHPCVQKGRFNSRFHGKSGEVTGKKGSCVAVQIKDGGKQKTLYVHPIHLKRL